MNGKYQIMDRLTTIVNGIRDGSIKFEDHFKAQSAQEDWNRAQDWVDLPREIFYIKYPDAKPKDNESRS